MNKIVNLILLFIILLFSCASLTSGLTNSLYRQKDVKLIEDGAPAYLLLIEALIETKPKDKNFLMIGIQMFSAYSGAFVKDQERSKIFTEKTKTWALMLLRTYPKFKEYENLEFDKYVKWVDTIQKNDIPYVFWAAEAWIMWIISNSDNIEAMLDLPKAKAVIDRIYKLDSSYYYGFPHLFYGLYYSVLPEYLGGNLIKSKEEFDRALEYSQDKFLMTKVYFAQYYYKAKNDKENFKKVLTEVINADIEKYPDLRLLNSFAKKYAEELLNKIDEIFYF